MTKHNILVTARGFFTTKGYDATSMEDIARAVGIKKPSLYAHFGGKEEIFRATFDQTMEGYSRHLDRVFEGIASLKTRDALVQIALRYAQAWEPEATNFWLRLSMSPPEFMKDEVLARLSVPDQEFQNRVQALITERTTRGDLRVVPQGAAAYLSLLTGLAINLSFGLMPGAQEQIQACVGVFLDGLERR